MIVSRRLESVQSSAGGTVLVIFLGVDSQDREWRRGRIRFPTLAAAEFASTNFDWDGFLSAHEERQVGVFIEQGGDPALFSLVNLSLPQFRTRML